MAPEAYSPTRQYEPARKRLQPRDVLVRAASAELMRTGNMGKFENVADTVARRVRVRRSDFVGQPEAI